MKRLLIALAIMAFATTAFAGANPDIRIYLEADPNNHIHETHMLDAPLTTAALITPATLPGCVPAPKACIIIIGTPNWRFPNR